MPIDLHWIPLGAGGTGLVRFNGRVYESIVARRERRRPLDLYHTALTVTVRNDEYVVETMWPSPKGDPAERGVVFQAPVFTRRAPRVRILQYEVRRWPGGDLPDRDHAIGGPSRVAADEAVSRRLLDLVDEVPRLVWGRDERGVGEMWNSNSVVSWLLTMAGVDMDAVGSPAEGRAPGWDAGVTVARATPGSP